MASNNETSGYEQDNDNEQTYGAGNLPNENPGEHSNDDELIYPHESEAEPQQEGASTSFSEGTDVTPPNTKEVPSVGAAKTDFESRNLGRTTGRMIGHEPGTESI